MYKDNAFGSATLRGDQPPLMPAPGVRARPRQDLLTWLTDRQLRWLASVRALSNDAELDRERLTEVVDETLQPESVSLWFKSQPAPLRAGALSQPDGPAEPMEPRCRSERIEHKRLASARRPRC